VEIFRSGQVGLPIASPFIRSLIYNQTKLAPAAGEHALFFPSGGYHRPLLLNILGIFMSR
jgi:hypothetical protein